MSAGANVKVSANSSTYQQALKAARDSTKELASQFSLASTQAKLFGSTTDQLKAKQQELTAKIKAQKEITSLHHTEVERLTKVLSDQKGRQQELAAQLQTTKAAYEAEKKATGANSDSTQELAKQVKDLESQQKKLDGQIGSTEGKLQKATIAENNSQKATLELEKALEDTNKKLKDAALDEFAKGLDKVTDKLEKAQKAANVVSGAAVAAGTAAVAAWDEVDNGADNVIKATGATGEAAEALEQTYKNVASSFAADFDTIGSTLGEVNTRFGYTDEAAEACTTKFLKFSEITGTDAVQAVQLVSRAMGDAGIEADDYGTLLDQLAVAAQASGISVDTLTSYITKYGAPMRALGFDTASSIAIFSQWEKCGVNTEIAFSGMKKAISTWSAEGKDARVEFQKTLDEIAACPDIASATTKAIEVFGTKAGPDLADAIQGGRFEYSQFLDLIESSAGTVETTYNGVADNAQNVQIAMNNLKLAGAELGDTIQESATPVLEKVTEILRDVTQWLQNADDDTKQNIVTVGLLVAALAPATAGLTAMVKGVRSGIDAYKLIRDGIGAAAGALTGETAQKIAATAATTAHTVATGAATVAQNGLAAAQGALNAVMAANPILLVVAALAALGVGLVLAYNNCEEFRAGVDAAIGKAKEVFSNFAQGVGDAITTAKQHLADLKENCATKMQEIGQTISTKWNEAKQKTTETWQNIQQTVGNKLQSVRTDTQQKLESVKQTMATALQNMQSNTQQRLAAIQQAYSSHGGGVRGVVAAYMTAIRQNYQSAYDAINSMTGGRFGNILDTIRSRMNSARDAVSSAINQIKGFFNFSWSLPHLAMPHPRVSGSFSLNPPSVPSFSIDWYATGGIMKNPTAFGVNGSRLMVGGEAGAEAILPLAPFYAQLEQMLDDKVTAALKAMRVVVYVENKLDGDDLTAKVTPRVSSALADEAERIR
jgi:TP901 family phage tail tape measure protein